MPTEPPQSTGYYIEECFVQSMLAHVTQPCTIAHYHNDTKNVTWPLVSAKATLDEEDSANIRFNGQPCEVFTVLLVAEWPLGDGSATEVDRLMRQCQKAIREMGAVAGLDKFSYFTMEALKESDKDIEPDDDSSPTRRVDISSVTVIAIRA